MVSVSVGAPESQSSVVLGCPLRQEKNLVQRDGGRESGAKRVIAGNWLRHWPDLRFT